MGRLSGSKTDQLGGAVRDRQSSASERIAAPVLAALALLVIGYRSWVPGPWLDEVVTIMSAQRSWPSLGMMLDKVDLVHGLYYAAMHVWFDMVGYSPLTLRAPSVVAMAIVTALLVTLAKRLVHWRAGVLAGLAFICMPSVTAAGMEGRSFAPATAALTLAIWLFVEAIDRHSSIWWAAYGVAVILATTLHLFCVLVFMTLPLVMSLSRAGIPQWRAFAISSGLAGLACFPFLLKVVSQQGQLGGLTPIGWGAIVSAPRSIWFPWPTWGGSPMIVGAWVILVASLTMLLISAGRRRWSSLAPLGVRGTLALILGWLLVPVIFVMAWSAIGSDIYAPRYMIITSPALALAMGVGLHSLRKASISWLLIGVALATSVALPWSAQRSPTGKGAQTAMVAQAVRTELREGDAVLFVRVGGRMTQPRNAKHSYPEVFGGADDLTMGLPYHQTDWLYDVDVPLAEVPGRLNGRTRVLAICQLQAGFPADNGDLHTLRGEGFDEVSSTVGTDWAVRVFERQES